MQTTLEPPTGCHRSVARPPYIDAHMWGKEMGPSIRLDAINKYRATLGLPEWPNIYSRKERSEMGWTGYEDELRRLATPPGAQSPPEEDGASGATAQSIPTNHPSKDGIYTIEVKGQDCTNGDALSMENLHTNSTEPAVQFTPWTMHLQLPLDSGLHSQARTRSGG